MSTTYETDFYAWANEQAALLRAGKLSVPSVCPWTFDQAADDNFWP